MVVNNCYDLGRVGSQMFTFLASLRRWAIAPIGRVPMIMRRKDLDAL